MLDEVVTGVLVNIISAAGRRMGAGLITLRSHRYKEDIELARWFDTYSLTANIPKLPVLPRTVTAEMLADALQRDEFHSVPHELLAARLTDAPQADIAHIRTSLPESCPNLHFLSALGSFSICGRQRQVDFASQ